MSNTPEGQGALKADDVIAAVFAVGSEASRRGKMYPQHADEHREDRQAVAAVVRMLRWYERNTGCANIKGWPAAPLAASPQVEIQEPKT